MEIVTTLIDVLKANRGAWLKRQEIARKLGRARLNPGEIMVLDMLAENGQIEKQFSTETYAPSGKVALYRIQGEN